MREVMGRETAADLVCFKVKGRFLSWGKSGNFKGYIRKLQGVNWETSSLCGRITNRSRDSSCQPVFTV